LFLNSFQCHGVLQDQRQNGAWLDHANKLGRGALESAEGFADRVDGAAQKAAERAQVAAAQAKVKIGKNNCVRNEWDKRTRGLETTDFLLRCAILST